MPSTCFCCLAAVLLATTGTVTKAEAICYDLSTLTNDDGSKV